MSKDSNPENPRNDENLGQLLLFHRKYNLGDELGYAERDFSDFKDMETFLREKEGAVVLLAVFGLDHGCFRIQVGNFNDPWDSGQLGYIWATAHDIAKWYGVPEPTQHHLDLARSVLIAEVAAYDAYLNREEA